MALRDFETRLLLGIQNKTESSFLARASVLLGIFGEHAQGWLLVGLIGLVVNWQNPLPWVTAIIAISISQLSSMVLKRLIKRRRPNHPSLRKSGKLFSNLSFPSSHSMSSATAALVLFPLVPIALGMFLVLLALGVLVSRLLIAAHFPTDVLMGAAMGLIIGFVTNVFF